MPEIRFTNDAKGVTTFSCANPFHGDIDMKIEPMGDLTEGAVPAYRLHFFGLQAEFPTNFKADCTARALGAFWCQAPGRNREMETQAAWDAALLASKAFPEW